MQSPSITPLTATAVAQLDPYAFLLVVSEKKTSAQRGAVAQAEEVAEGLSPERMS